MDQKYNFEEPFNEYPYTDLLSIYAHSFADNFSLPALTDYITGKTMSYGDMARRIARLHLFLRLPVCAKVIRWHSLARTRQIG